MLNLLPRLSTVYTVLILLLSIVIFTIKQLGIAGLVEIVPQIGLVWQAPKYTPVAVPTAAPVAAPTSPPGPIPPDVCAISSAFTPSETVCTVRTTVAPM